jgi:hypothetical protein
MAGMAEGNCRGSVTPSIVPFEFGSNVHPNKVCKMNPGQEVGQGYMGDCQRQIEKWLNSISWRLQKIHVSHLLIPMTLKGICLQLVLTMLPDTYIDIILDIESQVMPCSQECVGE